MRRNIFKNPGFIRQMGKDSSNANTDNNLSVASFHRINPAVRPVKTGVPTVLLLISLLLLSVTIFAEPIALQSFENTAEDSWGYTANPSPDAKHIWWGPTTEMMGGAEPYHGSMYWAGWDLDNGEYTLSFEGITLNPAISYTVSLYYYTKNLGADGEYCRYSLMFDEGENWENWVLLENNSQTWANMTVDLPKGSSFVRLRLSSYFDGTTKYAHWDYITLNQPDPAPPVISNLNVSQRTDGSKLVDIYYDLIDVNNDLCEVSMKLSNDGGNSFDYVPSSTNLSGDIGENIVPGTGKSIVWDVGAEDIDFDDSQYVFRFIADDGTCPMPENFVFVKGGTIYPTAGYYGNGLTLGDFYIDRYQLTQAEYEAVMVTNPSHFSGNSNHPVEQVSWFDAIEYCNRRSIQEGMPPCYSYLNYGSNPDRWPAGWNSDSNNAANVSCDWNAIGYRLPSDAEWEYAALGGLQTHGYTYSGSNNIYEVAWFWYNSGGTTHEVGSKLPNELGIYDMSGNVREWCWNFSGSYSVIRGGCWNSADSNCIVSNQYYNLAANGTNVIGFRICRNQ